MVRARLLVFVVIEIMWFGAFCQNRFPYDSITQKITYKEVVKNDSLKANNIFELATRWAQVHNDTSAKNQGPRFVIQRVDADSGKIVAIGKFTEEYEDYQQRLPLSVYYTLIIETRDGRSRIKITDLEHDDMNTLKIKPRPPHPFEETYFGLGDKSRPIKNAWLGFFTDCDKVLRGTIESYKKYMLQPPATKLVTDDW
jgi:hypothetical protein